MLKRGEVVEEKWRDIENYEGFYKVSNLGRVYSFKSKKILKGRNNCGYREVVLYNKEGKKTFKVHRLVAFTFCEGYEEGKQVDHINTIRDDNRAENLRWVTPKENVNNALTLKHIGDSSRGRVFTNEHKRKLKESQHRRQVVGFKDNGEYIVLESTNESNIKGFTQGNVLCCCRGERIKHKGYMWYYLDQIFDVYFGE